MDKYIEQIWNYLVKGREDAKIRSELIVLEGTEPVKYEASKTLPYSFEVFNVSGDDMIIDNVTVLTAGNSLPYPRVGIFRRTDNITIKKAGGLGSMEGFIRADLEVIEE